MDLTEHKVQAIASGWVWINRQLHNPRLFAVLESENIDEREDN